MSYGYKKKVLRYAKVFWPTINIYSVSKCILNTICDFFFARTIFHSFHLLRRNKVNQATNETKAIKIFFYCYMHCTVVFLYWIK